MIVVILAEKVFIFNIDTLKLLQQEDTYHNPAGLAAIATAEQPISKIVALPGVTQGSLQILNFGFVADKSIKL